MVDSAKSRRERAAQARAAADSQEKRRERIVRIIGGATVAVVVVGIIGGAWFVSQQEGNGNSFVIAEPDPNAPLPAGVLPGDDEFAYAVVFNPDAPAATPPLEIWEDFQCPACGSFEAAAGKNLTSLANNGEIKLIWRPTTFLDRNVGNDASTRAVAAWGCAIDAGKTLEFHDLLYANQPAEGQGWTDEQLLDFGAQVGLTGDAQTTFNQCVTDRTYAPWAANSTQIFYDQGIQGTPFVRLQGNEVPSQLVADADAFAETLKNLTTP
jgi:protein-disulfide isomerase